VAAQLTDATDAADLFAEMRRRAANVPEALDAALAALGVDDLATAAAGVAAARADLDAVAGWDVDLVTLPVWVETSDAVVDAVERLIAAVTADDAAGAEQAAADFAELEPDATDADRALQIAISEGAATVVSAPLARLTAAIDAVEAQRADVGALLAEGRR
jgi:flagellin-like hook-associated protein FlgL